MTSNGRAHLPAPRTPDKPQDQIPTGGRVDAALEQAATRDVSAWLESGRGAAPQVSRQRAAVQPPTPLASAPLPEYLAWYCPSVDLAGRDLLNEGNDVRRLVAVNERIDLNIM